MWDVRLSTSSSTQRMLLGRGMGEKIRPEGPLAPGRATREGARSRKRRKRRKTVYSSAASAPPHSRYLSPVPPRILLVRFSSLGDVLLTTPLIRALAARHPAATIAALTKQVLGPAALGQPHLDRGARRSRRANRWSGSRARLRGATTPTASTCTAASRSRVLRLLVPGAWHGYANPAARAPRADHATSGTTTATTCRCRNATSRRRVTWTCAPDGAPAELFTSPAAEARAEEWLTRSGLDLKPPLVGSCSRRGPCDQALAAPALAEPRPNSWRSAGRDGGCRGGRGTVPRPRRSVAAAPGVVASAAGELDLQATGALLWRGPGCWCRATPAPMHLATAVGTPVVALFGPTVEAFGFFPYRAQSTVLQLPLGCRPCSSKGGPRCPLVHHQCLEGILPAQVLAATLEFCQ